MNEVEGFSSNKFEYKDECIDHSEESGMSTQFLCQHRLKKNQLIDLKQRFERYVNTSPVLDLTAVNVI